MTRQTDRPLTRITMSATHRPVHDLADGVRSGNVTIDPPYQRGDVWSQDQRIALVRSWLMGIPIAAAILNNRLTSAWIRTNRTPDGDLGPSYAVIDGRQRITTALMWFGDQLAVPASWFPSKLIEFDSPTDDGPYVTFGSLTIVGRRTCSNHFMLPCAEASVSTVQAEAEIYLLVNGGGTPQSGADMERAARIASELPEE